MPLVPEPPQRFRRTGRAEERHPTGCVRDGSASAVGLPALASNASRRSPLARVIAGLRQAVRPDVLPGVQVSLTYGVLKEQLRYVHFGQAHGLRCRDGFPSGPCTRSELGKRMSTHRKLCAEGLSTLRD
jgi:hypothetical protein